MIRFFRDMDLQVIRGMEQKCISKHLKNWVQRRFTEQHLSRISYRFEFKTGSKSERKSMKQNNRQTGAVYEQAAGRFLEAQGYRILESNYRCPRGEIDLIAVDGSYLVFCEVKFRKSLKTGHPFEAVDQ